MMASRFWIKNTVARKMSAGKAMRDKILCILSAALDHFFFTTIPTAMGTNMSTMFCIRSLPTGRCTATALPTALVTHAMMSGTVTRVMMLLQAVSDTERATSPLANIENTFDELPPGQQAISTKPIRKIGSRPKALPMSHASTGKMMIWPMRPASTGRGRVLNSLKSSIFRFRPNSNISRVKMGNTIQIVFIVYVLLHKTFALDFDGQTS